MDRYKWYPGVEAVRVAELPEFVSLSDPFELCDMDIQGLADVLSSETSADTGAGGVGGEGSEGGGVKEGGDGEEEGGEEREKEGEGRPTEGMETQSAKNEGCGARATTHVNSWGSGSHGESRTLCVDARARGTLNCVVIWWEAEVRLL